MYKGLVALRCPAECHHYAEVGVRSDIGPANDIPPPGACCGSPGPGHGAQLRCEELQYKQKQV